MTSLAVGLVDVNAVTASNRVAPRITDEDLASRDRPWLRLHSLILSLQVKYSISALDPELAADFFLKSRYLSRRLSCR